MKLRFLALFLFALCISNHLNVANGNSITSLNLTEPISISELRNDQFLRIGSFNIQSLGPTKMGRPDFVAKVIQIIARYDILLIQEIKDSKITKVISQLVSELNNYVKHRGIVYGFRISSRLGVPTSNYREQYAYLYRTSTENNPRTIAITSAFVYDDEDSLFARPPYIAEFKVSGSQLSITEFTLFNVHFRTTHVPEETIALNRAIRDYVEDRYDESIESLNGDVNIGVMGDFNLDTPYISKKKLGLVKMVLHYMKWYIDDETNTTLGDSKKAFDRILITGRAFNKAIVEDSTEVYFFDKALGLNSTEAKKISDHYPVEFRIL